jgi:hypothetical protein
MFEPTQMTGKINYKGKIKSTAGLTVVITIITMIQSCEKIFMQPDAQADPVSVFEEIWTFADRHYSFFDYKQIDWQESYNRYRPLAGDNLTSVRLFDLCAEMLYDLRDGHVNLVSPFDRSRYWEWYLGSPENFSYALLERSYFRNNQRFIGPFHYLDMGEIIYIYYGSFSNTISESSLDIIIQNLAGKKGLIIDVRNNGGGSIENATRMASRFTGEKRLAGYNFVKTGPGHNDFRKSEIYIEPHKGTRYSGEVVVLTNRKSYSATTYFTQFMSVLPNVTFVGDITGGGGGMPAFHDLPNGWLLRVSSSKFYSPQGFNIESGIPPHVRVNMSEESVSEGKDDILETAISILNEGR